MCAPKLSTSLLLQWLAVFAGEAASTLLSWTKGDGEKPIPVKTSLCSLYHREAQCSHPATRWLAGLRKCHSRIQRWTLLLGTEP